jgi:hypothetical protein
VIRVWGRPCVREVLSWAAFSRYRKKETKKHIFFGLFSGMVGVVPDDGGIH